MEIDLRISRIFGIWQDIGKIYMGIEREFAHEDFS
jgi:hypothetical protein